MITSTTFLPLEETRVKCPSIFAVKPSPRVSDRYTFVSTADILKPLLKDGWGITLAQQRKTRANGRNPEFTRHMVRLRRTDARALVGDVFPEVVVSNSHDRQSRFSIQGGLYRLVCSNGMVIGIGKGTASGGVMVHLGDFARIYELINSALETAVNSGKQVSGMMKKKLTDQAQAKFAARAAQLAYEGESAFDPKLLLTPRRDEDQASDLWTVYNRVQENIVRGGVKYITTEKREITTRGITHIGRTLGLNGGLWDLAAEFLPKAA